MIEILALATSDPQIDLRLEAIYASLSHGNDAKVIILPDNFTSHVSKAIFWEMYQHATSLLLQTIKKNRSDVLDDDITLSGLRPLAKQSHVWI